ncbi:MAG: signal peptidase II [Chthoniobacteraceae bacterium]
MKFLAAVALPLFALDQATKWWIVARLALSHEWPPIDPAAHIAVIPEWFHLVYWANTGAAFSIGRDNNWFFVVLSLAALVGLLVASARGAFTDRLSRTGVGLLIAGILGNVTDRLIHHHVVDFLLIDLHVRFADPWPAFNVADSCICTAVALFIIGTLREEAAKKRG